jgi:hypothetical protein
MLIGMLVIGSMPSRFDGKHPVGINRGPVCAGQRHLFPGFVCPFHVHFLLLDFFQWYDFHGDYFEVKDRQVGTELT